MIQEKTINLLLVLVTGRVWNNKGRLPKKLDMWNCNYWMQIIEDCFMPDIMHLIIDAYSKQNNMRNANANNRRNANANQSN